MALPAGYDFFSAVDDAWPMFLVTHLTMSVLRT